MKNKHLLEGLQILSKYWKEDADAFPYKKHFGGFADYLGVDYLREPVSIEDSARLEEIGWVLDNGDWMAEI